MALLLHLAPYFAGAAALIGVILRIFGVLGKTARFLSAVVPSPWRTRKEREAMRADVAIIRKEVTPNGGGSLKDMVSAISRDQAVLVQCYWAVLNDDSEGWIRSGRNGECLRVNRTLCNLISRTSEDFLGRNFENLIDPAERDDVVEDWDRCVRLGKEFSRDVAFTRPDGSTVRCHVQTTVIRDAGGRPVEHVGRVKPTASGFCPVR